MCVLLIDQLSTGCLRRTQMLLNDMAESGVRSPCTAMSGIRYIMESHEEAAESQIRERFGRIVHLALWRVEQQERVA